MEKAIYIISAIGLALCFYILWVEHKTKKDSNYKAACDISNRASCTRTFLSSYGKIFGVSNGWWGMLFYISILSLFLLGKNDLVFYASLAGLVFSVRLAYLLYFRLKNFCMVCTMIYAVNILMAFFAWKLS